MDLVSEDCIRKVIKMPPRGIYGIPQSKRYVLNSTIKKRYGADAIDKEYSIGMTSYNMSEGEAEYAPLIVRLLSCSDNIILKLAKCRRADEVRMKAAIHLIRVALGIEKFDSDMEVITPVKKSTGEDNKSGRKTPVASSESDMESE